MIEHFYFSVSAFHLRCTSRLAPNKLMGKNGDCYFYCFNFLWLFDEFLISACC